jgi:hypothetical protein
MAVVLKAEGKGLSQGKGISRETKITEDRDTVVHTWPW